MLLLRSTYRRELRMEVGCMHWQPMQHGYWATGVLLPGCVAPKAGTTGLALAGFGLPY